MLKQLVYLLINVDLFQSDYMHSMCLGCIKTIVLLWISKENKGQEWYIGDKIAIVNSRLMKV